MKSNAEIQELRSRDDAYLSKLGDMPSELVFILGPHRSGTTFLHNLLVQTGQFSYISAYDVINYDEILYNHFHNKEKQVKDALHQEILHHQKNRGVDQLAVGADLPEEFGFILQGDNFFEPKLTPKNLSRFQELCYKKQLIESNNKPLILKEPCEFYGNFLFISQQFPQARFIFNHRHPLHTLNSHIKSWVKALDEKNHYLGLLDRHYENMMNDQRERLKFQFFFRSEKGCEWIIEKLLTAYQYYFDHVGQLPTENYYSINYEAFCANPSENMGRLMEFLGIREVKVNDDFIKTRESELLPMVLKTYKKYQQEFKKYLNHFHYPIFP